MPGFFVFWYNPRYNISMIIPTRREENKLRKKGYKYIVGLDEAGRGAWAGPLVAAAVILPEGKVLGGLKDSKLLSPITRKMLYLEIIKEALNWSVGIVSERTIDNVGLGRANIMAMEQAIKRLTIEPDYLLIDSIKLSRLSIPSKSINKADQRISSVAAASIVAKVTRDFILTGEHKKFPLYGFDKHKGYGTEEHYQMICQHGICRIHRKSFRPIRELLKSKSVSKV